MAAEAGHGGRGVVCVRACPFLGAHILVPVGTGLEMGLPGQLMLGGGAGAERGASPHAHPVFLFAWMPLVKGVGVGAGWASSLWFHLFLVVKLTPSPPPNPGALTSVPGHSAQPHLSFTPSTFLNSPALSPPWSFLHTPR